MIQLEQRHKLVELRKIGKQTGFGDRNRLDIWMRLLDVDMKYRLRLIKQFNSRPNPNHNYIEQINKDVNRSFNTLDELKGKEDKK